MADILKITTPIINKNQIQPNRPGTDPTVPFSMQEISKVVKTGGQGEILKQNSGMIQKEEASTILMNLLKDPAVAANFLKSISMLQEIVKLLSANNETMSQEIGQLFDSLLVTGDEIAPEMALQQNSSTAFKGELFDLLRDLIQQNPSPEIKYGVANLLKAINGMTGGKAALDAVANSLTFLSESLSASKALSGRLEGLAFRFRQEDAPQNFRALKAEVITLLKDVEESILYTVKLSKVVSITNYNLSRFNDNPDFFKEAVSNLLMQMDGRQQKALLLDSVQSFVDRLRQGPRKGQDSHIMDVLAKILRSQSDDSSVNIVNSEKMDKIIHSLLSSPCNFTPLLHFVIPVEHMDMKSFAEIWIDPNEQEDQPENEGGGGRDIHMLIVFDIEGLGQFEAELFVRGKTINFSLLCPPAYAEAFSNLKNRLPKGIAGLDYSFGDIRVDKLDRSRSLMDVFKTLPHKRTGVDVKA